LHSYELDPDDEPWSNEVKKKMIQAINPENEIYRWLVLTEKDDQVIGYARLRYVTKLAKNYDSAKNFADTEILVTKDHRRKGIGTNLLRNIIDKVKENDLLTTVSMNYVHDIGQGFCEKFNGKVVQKEAEYRAYFTNIDWDLMNKWKKVGESIAQKEGITLEKFDHCPENLLEKYVEIYTETVNQRPLGEIQIIHRITPDSRRDQEKLWIDDRGHKWHTIATVESDGTISGLTEMIYIVESPYYIEQLLTGVREQYRGRGLGKWLKAEMALFVRNQYSKIEYIQTGNADVNEPMLSINERMNFKHRHSLITYHFDLRTLNELLRG